MLTMNSGRAGLFLVLLGLISCRDDPNGPSTSELTLEMRRGDTPFEEETLAPGATLQLAATLLDATGGTQNAGSVDWASTNSAVASVDGTGKVTALEVGTTKIIVSAGERADTGVVNVAGAVSGTLECAPGDAGLTMAVGEVRLFVGPEAVDLCLPGGASGADFVVVPFNASSTSGAQLDTRIVASLPSAPTTSLAPSTSLASIPQLPFARGAVADERFHQAHLERSHAEFESALRATSGAPAIAARAVPVMGELLRLNSATLSGSGCSNPDYRTGRVVAISDRAVIVADTMNPRNGFSAANYATIGDAFDDLIWQVDTENFGEPTDIDDNDRVIIFYTRAVNELTPANADSYVGGFFYNRDLFSTSGANACAGSNEAEMFYMLAPDPNGEVNGNARSTSFVLERTFSVLAHEFQHLINDSRRLYVNDALVWEDSWLNEGLSHIAEELAFYAASGLAPGQNLGTSALVGATAQAFNRYNLDNVERYIRYLRAPEENSLLGNVDQLATRGAAWAFLRYVADRDAGDDTAMWTRLVNSTSLGLTNLEQVMGANPRDWMHDWQVSVFTDDAGFAIAERYTQPSWNFRVLTPVLDQSGQFPLRTRGVGPTSPSVLLQGGGAVFLRLGLTATTQRALRTTVNDLPPPSRLRLAVVRTR
jgi:hypothetical protein